jgi:AraC family transcriptional regulator, regulatory protein of adaptative response / DNA-3-methyladenine glycosylase II
LISAPASELDPPEAIALDVELCERARLARDPRFDGRFFIGVRTTGIYCRPVCPVRPPKPENVRFFPSAAAASDAGFRPCLRCRPESSPGTSAWLGTVATVSRALRLIDAGALDESGVEALATRLGIGARHLDRLFSRHVGASPQKVAQTRRLALAKKLLDETALPITEIAHASGFGSVRRFNETFSASYGRPPSALRKSRASPRAGEQIRLRLAFRPPLDWKSSCDFLAQRSIAGVEQVTDGVYRRAIEVDGRLGWFAISALAGTNQLELGLAFPDLPGALVKIVTRVRRMFDLDADPLTIEGHLEQDAALSKRLRGARGLRVTGAFDGFELAVRAVLGQAVSVKAARTLASRVAARFGRPLSSGADDQVWQAFPAPETLVTAKLEELGVTRARSHTIRTLARQVAEGTLDLETPRDLDGFVAELSQLDGIAAWTAHYVALRALGEPDAFPSSDLGLLGGAERCLGARRRFTAATLEQRAEAWRPWRGYAALHLWRAYAER